MANVTKSSGTTASTTSSDAAITVLASGIVGCICDHLLLTSAGTAVYFWSIDGGTTWHYVNPAYIRHLLITGIAFKIGDTLTVKRVPSGTNASVFASLW